MKRNVQKTLNKSTNKKIKFKFNFKDKSIFEKDTMFEGKPFKIKGVIDFKEPDLKLEERE